VLVFITIYVQYMWNYFSKFFIEIIKLDTSNLLERFKRERNFLYRFQNMII